MADRRSFWAWCMESEEPTDQERAELAGRLSERYGVSLQPRPVPRAEDAALRAPRIAVPDSLAAWCSTTTYERAFHAYGAHFTDRTRAFNLDFPNPPDVVAHPSDDTELENTLDWCASNGYTAVPYGGGSSVVWGVNPPERCEASVTIALDRMNRVLEIDPISRAARIQAGVLGPQLEDQLRPHGFTLRHFPQSFRFSSLGGWIATRSGGHYATNHTHIDDFVESVRMLTPRGWWESRRLPGSGAGPSPDRMVLGSEGILGIISEAWMRLQARPRFRATAGVTFPTWADGYEAVRQIVQAKLWPANCRILDPAEAGRAAGMDGQQSLVIVSFESAELTQRHNIAQAVEVARSCGGQIPDDEIRVDDGEGAPTGREGAVGAWRDAFIGVGPGVETSLGLVADTFETAITWDRWPEFDAVVRDRINRVLKTVFGHDPMLSCRFTHVYTDGPAPYYTWSGFGRQGSEISMWQDVKSAANEAVVEAGGTVTHHHAVGRMHRPGGYDRQRPDLFADALRAAKKSLDPGGILNPGVLIDP
ncbi:MAG: alkyldihydroxyacetonephosphate synthase [Acidimicrobiia bacterium]|jgi:alkyldihydroxyacetonephosphate synthase|nr:alkyldihydroxyacetonephosphate synthase [Acidimicrobiia bacterium]